MKANIADLLPMLSSILQSPLAAELLSSLLSGKGKEVPHVSASSSPPPVEGAPEAEQREEKSVAEKGQTEQAEETPPDNADEAPAESVDTESTQEQSKAEDSPVFAINTEAQGTDSQAVGSRARYIRRHHLCQKRVSLLRELCPYLKESRAHRAEKMIHALELYDLLTDTEGDTYHV